MPNIPISTYRLQFHKDFSFSKLEDIIAYLHDLGISTIYASPVFSAREGTTHGYDVIDPLHIHHETGSLQQLREISNSLKELGIGWLQDIVPNHMAFDQHNSWLMDVLENGRQSAHAHFFDIEWEHPDPLLKGKIMLPFLGKPLDDMLGDNEVQLVITGEKLKVQVYENLYPVSSATFKQLLAETSLSSEIIPGETEKEVFEPEQLQKIEKTLEEWNGHPEKIREVLEMQYYRLCFWKESQEKINYRRFFTINELICLNMQKEEVFSTYHKLISGLVEEGIFTGLRIDHVDGLFDPLEYLWRLRKMCGNEVYIVIEKILEWDEELPGGWPIQGTSGYDFIPLVNHLFSDKEQGEAFYNIYHSVLPNASEYDDLVYRKKLFILLKRMGGEWDNLARLANQTMNETGEIPFGHLRKAIAVYLAMFPVYRIYGNELPLSTPELMKMGRALLMAKEREPELGKAFDLLKNAFIDIPGDDEGTRKKKLYFLKRMQQFTGPLAAKGVEDTSFYIYSRLISHNEVGDSPEKFGLELEEFHRHMLTRLERYPDTMNTTSTHDTKRGEDARMRLNALSEIPGIWQQKVNHWMAINKKYIAEHEGKVPPDPREEYFIYQTLLSILPFDGNVDETFVIRMNAYMEKALREAKVNSNWSEPNVEYEQKVEDFIHNIMVDDHFMNEELLPLTKRLAFFGALYSLSQVVLKLAAPGVPDIYQGCELWNFSLVDPDNRGPVDYTTCKAYLEQLKAFEKDPGDFLQKLMEDYPSGKIKLFLTWKLLNCRKKNHELFSRGRYLPLYAEGDKSNSIVAFARENEGRVAVAIMPRLLQKFAREGEWPLGKLWRGNSIKVDFSGNFTNIFSGTKHSLQNSIDVSDAFAGLPYALLISDK